MDKFQLTIIKQNRTLLVVLTFIISMIGALFLAFRLESNFLRIIAPLFLLITVNGLTIYYAHCTLNIRSDGEKLMFQWSKKSFFNFKPIDSINLNDIQTLVINTIPGEQTESLHSIIYKSQRIKIETAKYWRKDADAFINYHKTNSDAKVKDSWDIIREKGFLSLFYYAILVLLIAGAILPTYWIIDKGFSNVKAQTLFLFFVSYFSLIPYWFVIKQKLD